jgi:hypothetical protein
MRLSANSSWLHVYTKFQHSLNRYRYDHGPWKLPGGQTTWHVTRVSSYTGVWQLDENILSINPERNPYTITLQVCVTQPHSVPVYGGTPVAASSPYIRMHFCHFQCGLTALLSVQVWTYPGHNTMCMSSTARKMLSYAYLYQYGLSATPSNTLHPAFHPQRLILEFDTAMAPTMYRNPAVGDMALSRHSAMIT